MDSYRMEIFAEARRQGLVDDAENRRLIRSIEIDANDGGLGRADGPLAFARRLLQLVAPRPSRPLA